MGSVRAQTGNPVAAVFLLSLVFFAVHLVAYWLVVGRLVGWGTSLAFFGVSIFLQLAYAGLKGLLEGR